MNDFATNQPAGMAGAQRHKNFKKSYFADNICFVILGVPISPKIRMLLLKKLQKLYILTYYNLEALT